MISVFKRGLNPKEKVARTLGLIESVLVVFLLMLIAFVLFIII